MTKRKISTLPKDEQCLIIAGSQGQMGSSLERIATGDHKAVTLDPGDKVIFSADPIPGNESNVYGLIDLLSRHGMGASYSDISSDLHVSGHASAKEYDAHRHDQAKVCLAYRWHSSPQYPI